MNWLVRALKYVATHPWVWMFAEKTGRYIVKPIINKFKKKKNG